VARLGRPGGLSAAGEKELWERWRAGESISDIARALRKAPGSMHRIIEATGGFSLSERRRRGCALTLAEREEISRGLATGESLRAIADRLGRSASSICREVNRNGGRNRYRATRADQGEALSIRERPPEVEDRAVPGHWEGDPLSGSRNTHVATLVERSSRFVMLVRVGGNDTESVVCALGEQVRRLPATMMATLTWDRGPEMAAHKKFTVATDVSVYFFDPRSPWQRGTSENTNRLLRQYLPRKTDLSVYDQDDLDLIALKLNRRARKTLGYNTPAATLAKTVALTG
jgi:IS30 family transposase